MISIFERERVRERKREREREREKERERQIKRQRGAPDSGKCHCCCCNRLVMEKSGRTGKRSYVNKQIHKKNGSCRVDYKQKSLFF